MTCLYIIKTSQGHSVHTACGISLDKRKQDHYHSRYPRHTPIDQAMQKDGALYFNGSNIIQLPVESMQLTNGFSLEFWIKVEGGQQANTIIVGLYDRCFLRYQSLKIGLKDKGDSRQSTLYYSLQTDSSHSISTIDGPTTVIIGKWIHVAATYNQEKMKFYINGALMGINTRQKGQLLAHHTAECRVLYVGGGHDLGQQDNDKDDNYNDNQYYRGSIDHFRIYNYSRSHQSIKGDIDQLNRNSRYHHYHHHHRHHHKHHKHHKHHRHHRHHRHHHKHHHHSHNNSKINQDSVGLVYEESFDGVVNWITPEFHKPKRIHSTRHDSYHQLEIEPPSCGLTLCDNQDIMTNYLRHSRQWQHTPKVIKYRLINLYNNDGSQPLITQQQIQVQHRYLLQHFAPYGIQWKLYEHKIYNTTLRQRQVLAGCKPSMIGDESCQQECNAAVTGYDGGDCYKPMHHQTSPLCHDDNLGNGICDHQCNKRSYNWDNGDCCQLDATSTDATTSAITNCIDPNSLYRNYLSVEEYKNIIHLTNEDYLNIYFTDWTWDNLLGIATAPWDRYAKSIQGGTLLKAAYYGRPDYLDVMVHEIGHNLGLWHVHHGITEMQCSNPCYERYPSMALGDLCSDTSPTPANDQCQPPLSNDNPCYDEIKYNNTPYRNFMSYSNGSCQHKIFTPQQVARMHCYIDQHFASWLIDDNPTPSIIPIPPQIIAVDHHHLQIAWIPPLRDQRHAICQQCHDNGALVQYVTKVSSPYTYRSTGEHSWSPEDALKGSPDAKVCNYGTNAWIAHEYCNSSCYVEVGFDRLAIARQLKIWVSFTYHGLPALHNVVLYYQDGSQRSLGSQMVQCDQPFTTTLWSDQIVTRIRIYISHPDVAIDAVQLTSLPHHVACNYCQPITYRINRQPPFPSNQSATILTTNHFMDQWVIPSVSYTYTVQAISNTNQSGPLSSPLYYFHQNGFCGNGIIESGEDCDDGNRQDGDGCNLLCEIEQFFHCRDQPSLCYYYLRDNICEKFEEKISTHDCGYYTPEGFRDQWASHAVANPQFQSGECDDFNTLLLGPPSVDQCISNIDMSSILDEAPPAWYPCGHHYENANYWVQVSFERPVIASSVLIYLATDGYSILFTARERIYVQLIDVENGTHDITPKGILASCHASPLTISLTHNMTNTFYYTKAVKILFKSYEIAISAVRLRSLILTESFIAHQCGKNEYYNPRTQRCYAYPCHQVQCSPYITKTANVSCSSNYEGATCTVTCQHGYNSLNGPSYQIQCIQGQWIDQGHSCRAIDCGQPPKVEYAITACLDGTTAGKVCTYKCKSPARMIGKNTTLTCTSKGYWTLPQSYCYLTCNSPRQPANSVNFGCTNARYRKNKLFQIGLYNIGSYCKFHCAKGYESSNRYGLKSALSRTVCSWTGHWEGDRCVPVVCPSPPVLKYGKYNCTGTSYKSACIRTCFDGSHKKDSPKTITCGSDRKWHGVVEHCPPPTQNCLKPKVSPGMEATCPHGFAIGQSCTITCKINEKTPNYEHITCSSNQVWQPAVSQLKCNLRCIPDYYGDGWCDIENNRYECQYDGGDCCQSTSMENSVLYMMEEYCSNAPIPAECQCLDPQAQENKSLR